jgi:hypothetical protein
MLPYHPDFLKSDFWAWSAWIFFLTTLKCGRGQKSGAHNPELKKVRFLDLEKLPADQWLDYPPSVISLNIRPCTYGEFSSMLSKPAGGKQPPPQPWPSPQEMAPYRRI